uniref:SpoIIE family protein phosphatase n=1 Tax=Siminovitchia fortis TaxID=254758 RepID=UPI001642EB9E
MGIGIGEVMGKGMGGGVWMWMMKYGMESLGEDEVGGGRIVKMLKGVVERNVDARMLIRMWFGVYDEGEDT